MAIDLKISPSDAPCYARNIRNMYLDFENRIQRFAELLNFKEFKKHKESKGTQKTLRITEESLDKRKKSSAALPNPKKP